MDVHTYVIVVYKIRLFLVTPLGIQALELTSDGLVVASN